MAPTTTKGQHASFDVPPSITVTQQLTALLTSPLPYGTDGMSSHQLAQSLSLYCWDYPCLLCLPLTVSATVEPPYLLLATINSIFSRGAGRSWKKGHDIVAKALEFEIRRLGMGVVDSGFTMKNDFAHPTSQKRGDIAVTCNLPLTDTFNSPMLWIDTHALIYY